MRKSRGHKPTAKKTKEPAWVTDESVSPPRALSKHELEDLVVNVQRGIQDTPAWKDLVQRFGKGEAQRILGLALYNRHGIAGNPDN